MDEDRQRPNDSKDAADAADSKDAASDAASNEEDAKARAKREAIEKAKELAKRKAEARKAAGGGAPAGKPAATKGAAAKGAAAKKKEVEPPPEPPKPLQEVLQALEEAFAGVSFSSEYNPVDRYLYIDTPAERLLEVGRFLRDRFQLHYLRCLSGVDWKTKLQVVYHLVAITTDRDKEQRPVALRVDTDRERAELPSVVDIWPTADWHEREAFDMFGIRFRGHPNLRRLLLPPNWQGGYPLRKDFVDKRPKRQRKVRPR